MKDGDDMNKEPVGSEDILWNLKLEDAELDKWIEEEGLKLNTVRVYGNVELDSDEYELLQYRPEYCLYARIDDHEMRVKIEMALCKLRWNRMSNGYGDD